MFRRLLDLEALLARKSVLFLGPRLTGKSTLARSAFPDCLYVDLLSASEFRAIAAHPEQLGDRLRAHRPAATKHGSVVVIDEIQKLPSLLDEVHRLIVADPKVRFLLTGSSARKLSSRSTSCWSRRATQPLG